MTKIKSSEELKGSVERDEELLPDVLIAAYQISDSHPPGSIVSFDAAEIVGLLGVNEEQVTRAMYLLDKKGLLELFSMSGDFKITDYGVAAARDLLIQQVEQMKEIQSKESRQFIFIIHGHDEELKGEVSGYIKSLGLAPVVLHEVEDRGRTIIEKLEHEVARAKFAIALWSPDDETSDGMARARQNVILETGIFCQALTRKGVRILIKGSVEIPSDLAGELRTHYDSSGKWKAELVREMRAAGISIEGSA